MKPTETVRSKLIRITENWESIPIRVCQDGKWQALYLSEVESQAEIARAIIGWLAPYILYDPDTSTSQTDIVGLRSFLPRS